MRQQETHKTNKKVNRSYIQLDPRDNLLVALKDLKKGEIIEIDTLHIVLKEDIKQKHKFTVSTLKKGEATILYGVLVGKTQQVITAGSAITTENLKHDAATFKTNRNVYTWKKPEVSKFKDATFLGYHRPDNRVGTANFWLVIPLVFCENRNVDIVEDALLKALGYQTKMDYVIDTQALVEKYKAGATQKELYSTAILMERDELTKKRLFTNVDGIKFLKHEGGCGGTREDSDTLCRLLAGYITNPNVGGATILSLGCQNAQIEMLQQSIKQIDPKFSKPIIYLEQQKSSNERSFVETAVKETFIGLIKANDIERAPAPLSKLTLGLECGGSDGFSGLSANPALGHAADLLIALGGTAVLSEFPELNGVEQELINRCSDQESANKFAELMRHYAAAAIKAGSGFENNPSPGNIKDGLITDAIKSAGAAKKGGTSPVTAVLDYTEQVIKPGLNLLCTPGNDVESTTGLAGSGCNLIVFTTGLGTPTGNPITPVVKISSNTTLYNRMNANIDLNAGTIITGEKSIEEMGEEILTYLIQLASGQFQTKAMLKGQNDFIPWKRGISL